MLTTGKKNIPTADWKRVVLYLVEIKVGQVNYFTPDIFPSLDLLLSNLSISLFPEPVNNN